MTPFHFPFTSDMKTLKTFTNSKTKVLIGQLVSIGNRTKYSATDFPSTKFIDLYPDDVGIFLGNYAHRYGNGEPWEIEYKEVAAFSRLERLVVLSEGVLTPLERND